MEDPALAYIMPDDEGKKPRLRFCWVCSRQLRGRSHSEVEIDGSKRIVHKACASGKPDEHPGTEDDFYAHGHMGRCPL